MKELEHEDFRKIASSSHISFLFGAGVNGNAFPGFWNGFDQTKDALKKEGLPGENIESELSSLKDPEIVSGILEIFASEYRGYLNEIDYSNESIAHLGELLRATDRLVELAENRTPSMCKINVFTLNYDRIVENTLEDLGLLRYSLTSSKSKAMLPFDIVGYNTSKHLFIPTFVTYKIHGSISASNKLAVDEIVLPSATKSQNVISRFYETLFEMKGELLRANSLLFVIGYSWQDDHINSVLSDAVEAGLCLCAVPYDNAGREKLSKLSFADKIYYLNPVSLDESSFQDSTKTLSDEFYRCVARNDLSAAGSSEAEKGLE